MEGGFQFGTGDHPSGYFLSSVNLTGDLLEVHYPAPASAIWSARTLAQSGEIVPDVPVISLVRPQRTVDTRP